MVKHIYICDRCKKEVGEHDLVNIGLGVKQRNYTGNSIYFSSDNVHNAQWCYGCCNETGIRLKDKKTPPPPESLPSLEDLIRGWIYEEIQEVK
jgi:hypothetical protein